MHLYGNIHRDHLLALAAATAAIGPRGEPSISELFGRVADAAEYDLGQTATLLAFLAESTPPTGATKKVYLLLRLGVAYEAERRKTALLRLAEALATTGYRRTRASVSRLSELLSAHAAADFDHTAAALREVMTIAAESYVLAAEEMAEQAAESVAPQPPRLGKYATQREAKLASDRKGSPFVVQFDDGSFDWYAHNGLVGYTTGDGRSVPYDRNRYYIVARYVIGRGWKTTSR